MENASTSGVLTHLSLLEVRARSRGGPDPQRSRVKELRAEAEELRGLREQLRAEIRALQGPVGCLLAEPDLLIRFHQQTSSMTRVCQHLQELRSSADPRLAEEPPLLQMMSRHLDLKETLHAHHLIGGFDAVRTRQGRAVCVTLQTAYEGVFLETFNLEVELKPRVRIGRHNIPPFIPLQSLAEQSRLQTDARAFLSVLSQHLNAFVGRRRQLQLLQEQHKAVEVMESNLLGSLLVLLFSVPPQKTALLCTLEYCDLASALPGRVHLDGEDKQLLESPEWRSCCATLMKTPVHKALAGMKKSRMIL